MAQSHFHGRSRSNAPSQQSSGSDGDPDGNKHQTPEYRDVKAQLLTHDDRAQDFLVYTAIVEPAFLMRFHEPAKAPWLRPGFGGVAAVTDAGLTVELTRVSMYPILGLKERLGNALGCDIAGEWYSEVAWGSYYIEMWGCVEERRTHFHGLKRRRVERGALAELLNESSFEVGGDEEDGSEEGDGPSPGGSKRRRCTNGSRSLEVC